MDQWLLDLVGLSPAAAVIVVVGLFLRHIQTSSKQLTMTLQQIGDGCHEHQEKLCDKMDVVVGENSKAIRENTTMLGRNLEALERINGG